MCVYFMFCEHQYWVEALFMTEKEWFQYYLKPRGLEMPSSVKMVRVAWADDKLIWQLIYTSKLDEHVNVSITNEGCFDVLLTIRRVCWFRHWHDCLAWVSLMTDDYTTFHRNNRMFKQWKFNVICYHFCGIDT